MIGQFTVTTFLARLGETFRVGTGSDLIEMSLVAANELDTATGGSRPTAPTGRTPFSVVFRGPSEPILPQRIYRFEHDALGPFDLFIVPISLDESGMQYEAVFG